MPDSLEQVLADARGELPVLRKHGAALSVDEATHLLDRIAAAAEPWLRMLPEPDAELFSDHATAWLRARYPEWAARGLATTKQGVRYYRECVLPHRADVAAAREAGRQAARASAGTSKGGRRAA